MEDLAHGYIPEKICNYIIGLHDQGPQLNDEDMQS